MNTKLQDLSAGEPPGCHNAQHTEPPTHHWPASESSGNFLARRQGAVMTDRVSLEAARSYAELTSLVRAAREAPRSTVPQLVTLKPKAANAAITGSEVLLNPKDIAPSPYCTRQDFHWESSSYKKFAANIKGTKGNVQAIKVRPARADSGHTFEIVFGHRRHRACFDAGLQVRAVIEEINDQQMLVQMFHENSDVQLCSPFERGCQFKKAVHDQVFATNTALADALGLTCSAVSKLIRLALLPADVVSAFRSPADINVNWGPVLHQALAKDRQGVLRRAREIGQTKEPRQPKLVLQKLLPQAPPQVPADTMRKLHITQLGKTVAVMHVPPAALGEGITVRFEPGAISETDLMNVLMRAFARPTGLAA